MSTSANGMLPGLLIVLLGLSAQAARGADSPAGTLKAGRIQSAKLMEHQPDISKYMLEPARYALVFVQVRISENGEALDAKLAEGGYHDKESVRSALQVARKLRFKPATIDGKPVEWNGVLPVRYYGVDMSGSNRVVSADFREEADKVQDFLKKKDFSGAQFHAQWMLSEKVHNDYEYAILQTTLADSFARNSNIHRAMTVIRDVTRRSSLRVQEYEPGGPIPDVTVKDFALWRTPFELEHLLKLRSILAESQGMYLDALRAHADLQGLGFVKSGDPALVRFQNLLQQVNDAPSLTAHIRMDERSSWLHPLLRNHLRVSNIRTGKLNEIALNCPGYVRAYPYVPGEDISIPDDWHGCDAVFTGTPGTEFDITELRDAPDAAAAAAAATVN